MPSSRSSRRRVGHGRFLAGAVGLAIVAAALVAGCGAPSSAAPSSAALVITNAWVRPPIGPDRPAAGYLTITNPAGAVDALVGASSPVATSVEIHETSIDSSGMAGMHPIDRLEIPMGGSVALEPGGFHMMLLGTGDTLKVGDKVQITLQFEHAGSVVIEAEVRAG